MAKRRYAIVGTGSRCVMFIDAIAGDYSTHAELVAFCDLSQTRMDWHNCRLKEEFGHEAIACYKADDFDRMIDEVKPDTVIVTSVDATHHIYIIRAMELGCDVICEKPMTTGADKGNAVFEAIDRTGRSLQVTFNCRYMPYFTAVKKVLMSGVIGTPTSVDFSWVLDTRHGADYFRRWHATKANSGGLLVHKSTHHFDLINWWLDAYPQTVYAMGDLRFYGRKNATVRGESYAYDRYTGHADLSTDPFARPLDQEDNLRGLYLNAEKDSGYIRDKNVFGSHVDIEDTMAVMVRYRTGVILNYSLVAYSPWEGFRAAITGTKGRVECYERHSPHIVGSQDGNGSSVLQAHGHQKAITVYPMFDVPYEVEIPKAKGGHGGGDPLLLEHLFSPNPPADPYHRAASHLDGAASMLIGISANESIATGRPVHCDDLIPLPNTEPLVNV